MSDPPAIGTQYEYEPTGSIWEVTAHNENTDSEVQIECVENDGSGMPVGTERWATTADLGSGPYVDPGAR